jgi:hypothetical protein
MFKLLEQLQLFDSDTISAKQVWIRGVDGHQDYAQEGYW